jgi:hypothetical protein
MRKLWAKFVYWYIWKFVAIKPGLNRKDW